MSAAADNSNTFGLDEALLTAAVTESQTSGRSTLEYLEERSGLGPVELTTALARALDYRVLTRADLARLEPAFDLLPRPRRRAATACWRAAARSCSP